MNPQPLSDAATSRTRPDGLLGIKQATRAMTAFNSSWAVFFQDDRWPVHTHAGRSW